MKSTSTNLENQIQRALIARIEQDRYDLWFHAHTRFALSPSQLTVGVPNLHLQEWLQKTFAADVRAAVADVVGDALPVKFVIDPELFRQARAEQEKVLLDAELTQTPSANPKSDSAPAAETKSEATPTEAAEGRKPRESKPRTIRKWKRLSEFVVGSCNRVAHASALSVVEEPGLGVNPLVFYGPVGTGKTHLLEGIYAGVRKGYPDFRVEYITAEDFTNRFVQSMHQNKQSSFRRHFRDCSVLLVDDLSFFANKKATQVEFLHTLDALLAEGHQVAVTMDCHPRFCEYLLEELSDRLLGGAVWSLLPPDAETRLAILRLRAVENGSSISEEVLRYLSQNLRGNVRELEGAIHSVRHFSKVTSRRIDITLAREALGDLLRHAIRTVGVGDIDHAICQLLRMTKGTLQSKARSWAVSHPRMLAIYLARKHTAATYGEISIYFGNKTHSTAVAAEKKVKRWIEENAKLKIADREWNVRELIERIERDLAK